MDDPDKSYSLITEEGFAYDFMCGLMLRGSTVSRECHQLADVESLKSELISDGLIYEAGGNYVCAQDIRTGILMAYNLHCNHLVRELPEWDIPFAPGSDEMISVNEALKLWSVYSADRVYTDAIEKDRFAEYKEEFYSKYYG